MSHKQTGHIPRWKYEDAAGVGGADSFVAIVERVNRFEGDSNAGRSDSYAVHNHGRWGCHAPVVKTPLGFGVGEAGTGQ
jgi:hypothetical protein